MLTLDPVKIPDIPKRIRVKEKDGHHYIQYLLSRPYDPDKGYNAPNWVNIGKQVETMPGLMFANDNYEKYFIEPGGDHMDETMSQEERTFTERNRIYEMYIPFFDALYFEFKQQTRKRPDDRLNRCKAECLNRVLNPLKEMMKDEAYTILLKPVVSDEEDGENGMNNSDVMILLTQFKSALEKYHKTHK